MTSEIRYNFSALNEILANTGPGEPGKAAEGRLLPACKILSEITSHCVAATPIVAFDERLEPCALTKQARQAC